MEYQLDKWQHSSWKKNSRFYGIELCQDLFGHWIVKRTWGSNKRRGFGRSSHTVCQSFETASILFEKQESRRLNRGYIAIDSRAK